MEDIIVTGYGIKAPGILNKSSFLNVLKKGVCTQSILKNVNEDQDNIVAGIIDEDFLEMNGRNYRRYPRSVRMAISAAIDAFEMSGLQNINPKRVAVIIGTSAGAVLEIEQYSATGLNYKNFPLHGVSIVDTHTLSSSVAESLGLCGPTFTLTTGCSASLDAVLMGKLLLENGTVDACIVGGTDAPLGSWTINGFKKLRVLSTEATIDQAGVPFSTKHRGFVLAEGAGIVVLERRKSAQDRKQKMYGKIERIISRNEGQKLLGSDETGAHMLEVFQEVVGNTKPSYVNSQALGIALNDKIERDNLMKTFSSEVPITSIKGMVGHAFGAMGAMQIISSLLSLEYGFIPPTIKTKGEGFEDVPIVYETRNQVVDSICITTHGSSGNNACLLLTQA